MQAEIELVNYMYEQDCVAESIKTHHELPVAKKVYLFARQQPPLDVKKWEGLWRAVTNEQFTLKQIPLEEVPVVLRDTDAYGDSTRLAFVIEQHKKEPFIQFQGVFFQKILNDSGYDTPCHVVFISSNDYAESCISYNRSILP